MTDSVTVFKSSIVVRLRINMTQICYCADGKVSINHKTLPLSMPELFG